MNKSKNKAIDRQGRGMKINSNEKGRVYPGPDSTIHY